MLTPPFYPPMRKVEETILDLKVQAHKNSRTLLIVKV
jgi:hypothetical protein